MKGFGGGLPADLLLLASWLFLLVQLRHVSERWRSRAKEERPGIRSGEDRLWIGWWGEMSLEEGGIGLRASWPVISEIGRGHAVGTVCWPGWRGLFFSFEPDTFMMCVCVHVERRDSDRDARQMVSTWFAVFPSCGLPAFSTHASFLNRLNNIVFTTVCNFHHAQLVALKHKLQSQ